MLSRIKSRRGFSLIELAVVLIVIGFIAAIAIPTFQKVIAKSEESAARASVEAVGRNAVAMAAFDRTSSGSVDPYSMLSEAVAETDGAVTQDAGTDGDLNTFDDVLTANGHGFTLTISGSKVKADPAP